MRDIGKNIRTLRTEKNMTQDALAEALFVTRQTVSNYETGRSRPDIDMLLRIAQVLDADIHTVLYGPAIPESRRAELWRMAAGAAVLGVLLAVFVLLLPLCSSRDFLYSGLKAMVKALLIPGMFLAGGWCAMQGAGLLLRAKPLTHRWAVWVRRGLIITLSAAGIVMMPWMVYEGVSLWHSLHRDSVILSFPNIPVVSTACMAVIRFNFELPFVYGLLGGLLWLVGFPAPGREKRTD